MRIEAILMVNVAIFRAPSQHLPLLPPYMGNFARGANCYHGDRPGTKGVDSISEHHNVGKFAKRSRLVNKEKVFRLQVPVCDVLSVQVRNAACCLTQNGGSILLLETAKLHDLVELFASLAHLENQVPVICRKKHYLHANLTRS